MSSLRGWTLSILANATIVTETCINCGILFGLAEDHQRELRKTGSRFYCPNGHHMFYTAKADAEKRAEQAEAQLVAARDQAEAALREAEQLRSEAARQRQRIANGACPCCNRYFDNVRRHMATQHPDYAAPDTGGRRIRFGCSCGATFDTYHGLRVHQGRSRRGDWAKSATPTYRRHLTEGATR